MIRKDYDLPQASSRSLLLGACADFSNSSGINPVLVRGAAIIALCIWFKLAVLAYCAAAIWYRVRR
jgi:phage shock protein PspC (stress-responsive transcriptional regulator)